MARGAEAPLSFQVVIIALFFLSARLNNVVNPTEPDLRCSKTGVAEGGG